MKFNIIGAGRLGKNLAIALNHSGNANLTAIYNKRLESAVTAVAQIGAGLAVSTLKNLPPADLIFITTSDDQITNIASQLLQARQVKNCIVVHCSGSLSSSILQPLKELGCQIASIHPLKAFSIDYLDPEAFKDCDCVIEGDEAAKEIISALFSSLGANVISIDAANKGGYHAGAVIASNYLVTLAAAAIELFVESNIPQEMAEQITKRLMQSSVNNILCAEKISKALTGPLARGDINTLNTHLKALNKPQIKNLYRAAALATLPLTQHDSTVGNRLMALFENSEAG